MTIKEARETILDNTAPFNAWVMAAGVLTSSAESTTDDLVNCLERKGLPAEMAAITLYVRTKRPQKDDSPLSVIVDPADWREFLQKTMAV